jgi:formylglycine-generating enzyme required for sulfatase activity
MQFVEIPAGSFTMGSPPNEQDRKADETAHEVVISKPFYLGVHEVNQECYRRVTGKNPSVFTLDLRSGGPNHPVENVSWNEAVAFCVQLSALPEEKSAGRSYRLPTEAEWEYACRAGTTTAYSTGETLSRSSANVRRSPETAGGRTLNVGSKDPNAWGLFDMHGNVWEWCRDWYAPDYYATSPQSDPAGPADGQLKVARGGSRANAADQCRSAYRLGLAPGIRLGMGFRVVLEVVDKK